jgi:hypothetical protein
MARIVRSADALHLFMPTVSGSCGIVQTAEQQFQPNMEN